MPTAAAIIIGDEILSGKFADENGPYLIERMRALGADLRRLVVIGDTIDAIGAEVRHCSDAYDLVVTTGGVGPTHDDVTLEGVAAAFGVGLERRPELVELLERFGMELNDAALRMATLPEGAELTWSDELAYPVVRVRNVIVMPGVPRLFRIKFEAISQWFAGEGIATERLVTIERETAIAERLRTAAERFPAVAIGSYPRYDERPYRVIVTLESRDRAALAAAMAWLSEQVVPWKANADEP